jgi:hypothetical protein
VSRGTDFRDLTSQFEIFPLLELSIGTYREWPGVRELDLCRDGILRVVPKMWKMYRCVRALYVLNSDTAVHELYIMR